MKTGQNNWWAFHGLDPSIPWKQCGAAVEAPGGILGDDYWWCEMQPQTIHCEKWINEGRPHCGEHRGIQRWTRPPAIPGMGTQSGEMLVSWADQPPEPLRQSLPGLTPEYFDTAEPWELELISGLHADEITAHGARRVALATCVAAREELSWTERADQIRGLLTPA